uniref:Retrotransposon Copia-like N-terminal domain-containing protein n=1 Tax=Opuntia streptacantha TaxID=393608 RepID=A0A7C8YWD1_OPUST
MNFAMAVQGNRPVQLEPTDPLYIHPSDQPGQLLVSTPFNGDNFDNWRRSVIIALSAKHKVALIDGSCECPAPTAPLHIFWQRNNAMVLSWLLNSLNDSIRNSVLYFEFARELWLDLEGRFGQSNKARLFQVQKDVSCLSQGDMDIASYYTKAKQLWDESSAVSAIPRCTCKKCECDINAKQQNYIEERRLIQFLMGLNGSYTAIRGNILMMVPFPSIRQAYSLLVQEERQRQVKTDTHFLTESASLSASLNKPLSIQDPSKTMQKKPDPARRSQLFCDHCKKPGHTIDKCYRLHGYPNRPTTRGRGGYVLPSNRRAYSTWTEHADQTAAPEPSTPAVPGLSAEQSKQLIQLLNNLSNGGSQKTSEQNNTGCHLAGPFSEEASGSW